jgi:hypothetical protein
MYTLLDLQAKTHAALKETGHELNVLPEGDRRRRQSWIDALVNVNPPLLQLLEVSPAAPVEQVQELIIETVEASPKAEDVQAQEPPIESNFGRIVYPRPAQGAISQVAKTSPAVEVDRVQEPISQVAKTSPAVEVDRVQEPISQVAKTSPGVEVDQLPECSHCFDDGYLEDASRLIKSCVCSSEPRLSRQNAQRAIVPAAKNLPGRSKTSSTAHQLLELFKTSAHIIEDAPASEIEQKVSQSAIEQAGKNQDFDLNPILTGLALSDRFLARYSPPQSEVFQFQTDADGQLTLIDFKVQSAPEPPDPDDFDSLDAFREAIALWDAQNLEPLAVSMDSMCEWAPCPEEWYEPEPESLPLKASSMMELSPPAIECSITSANFTIPTFDAWCDRANRQADDEPPDTGFYAKRPKPNPPDFPPQATWTQLEHKLNKSQGNSGQVRASQPGIPKLFSVATGSRSQPARSPPGGDANFA